MHKVLLSAAAVALAACSYKMQQPFDPAAYDAFKGTGTGSVAGQAFLRQQGGGVVTCAGAKVMALPTTAYTTELIEAGKYRSRFDLGDPQAQPVLTAVKKEGICDAQGNFKLTGLKPGNWIVFTEVSWSVGYNAQGGLVSAPVAIVDGQTANVIISR
ncbi:hypothetical protein FFK22_026240 [Mycobacterium sp. KBS0706]|uniref:hypothetical protein n=1 Tax=Mycobacterium sp. KBS0706 TaxID=2578109 RepID=UPI00110FB80E|nr:hypothetical protein [Mycobacterium sp. KBS0706]TSD85661.1 hypothetical protein FFK22_026240 [Mycobacterium sp. KBS0706]